MRTLSVIADVALLQAPAPGLVLCGGAWLAASVRRPVCAAVASTGDSSSGSSAAGAVGAHVAYPDGTFELDVVRDSTRASPLLTWQP